MKAGEMSWPRRHELFDVDLDAYDDEIDVDVKPSERQCEKAVEQKHVSVLEAAERAGIPLEVLLPKLDP